MTQPPNPPSRSGASPAVKVSKQPTSLTKTSSAQPKVKAPKPSLPKLTKEALRQGIRRNQPDAWRVLLAAVRKAQGNLMEVARQTGVSRETLRRWVNQYEVLKKAVEKVAKGNPMLWRQIRRWTPERRKVVSDRERQHQIKLGSSENFHWANRASIPLPPGVEVGKRAVWVVHPKNPLGMVSWGLIFVLRTTKESVFVLCYTRDKSFVRKVKPTNIIAWDSRHDSFFAKNLVKDVAKMERDHVDYYAKRA